MREIPFPAKDSERHIKGNFEELSTRDSCRSSPCLPFGTPRIGRHEVSRGRQEYLERKSAKNPPAFAPASSGSLTSPFYPDEAAGEGEKS